MTQVGGVSVVENRTSRVLAHEYHGYGALEHWVIRLFDLVAQLLVVNLGFPDSISSGYTCGRWLTVHQAIYVEHF